MHLDLNLVFQLPQIGFFVIIFSWLCYVAFHHNKPRENYNIGLL